MSKHFNICCPDCFSKDLYKYGKDKAGKQKYQCKTCLRQFTNDSSAKQNLNYPKCPVCSAGTYLHHDYEHYSKKFPKNIYLKILILLMNGMLMKL